jgi:hypothetical protein
MLLMFPWLGWLAVITSAVLLVMFFRAGDLGRRESGVLVVWFLVAASGQFLGWTTAVVTAGRVLQTVLAIYLVIRWKLVQL